MNSESKNFEKSHISSLFCFFLMSLIENQNVLNTLSNEEFGSFSSGSNLYNRQGNWRDGSTVKSAFYSCRGPRYISQRLELAS